MSEIDSEIDRALCRKAAAECTELARIAPEIKQTLLTRAQEWLKLTHSDRDAELERLLTEFNPQQMGPKGRRRPPPVQRMPMQQQACQQQTGARPDHEREGRRGKTDEAD